MAASHNRILVVDDDRPILSSYITYLEDSGYLATGVQSVSEAIVSIHKDLPDLIITDLKMPKESGLVLLEHLSKQHPDLPVIVVSGAGVMMDVVEALRFGAVDYFIKPILDLGMLVLAIERALERTRLVRENTEYRAQLEEVNNKLKSHIVALEQDQQAGHFVQQSLLPVSPFITETIHCEQKVIPSLYLSGDCVDYALLEKRYFSFYLADVSGHGSAPAFVAIWLKNLLVQLVRLRHLLTDFNRINEALNQLLTVANDQLISTHLNNNLTMVVGILDTQTNELFYAVAGHLPLPILLTANGARYLEGKGKVIGLQEDVSWDVHHLILPQKGKLILFSDGILEIASGKNLIEKEQSLLKNVSESDGSIKDLCDAFGIEDDIEAPDDIAMMSIAFTKKSFRSGGYAE